MLHRAVERPGEDPTSLSRLAAHFWIFKFDAKHGPLFGILTGTPQLPFGIHQLPANGGHKPLNSGTLRGVGTFPVICVEASSHEAFSDELAGDDS